MQLSWPTGLLLTDADRGQIRAWLVFARSGNSLSDCGGVTVDNLLTSSLVKPDFSLKISTRKRFEVYRAAVADKDAKFR